MNLDRGINHNRDDQLEENSGALIISKQLEAYNLSLQRVLLGLVKDSGNEGLKSLRNDLAAEIISTAKSLYDAIRNCCEESKKTKTDEERKNGDEDKGEKTKKQTISSNPISETIESSSRSSQLNDYRHSFKKVSEALSKDPTNEELLNLQKDLLELINLTEKGLLTDLDKPCDNSKEEKVNLTTVDIPKPCSPASLSSITSLDSLPDEILPKMIEEPLSPVSEGQLEEGEVEDRYVGNSIFRNVCNCCFEVDCGHQGAACPHKVKSQRSEEVWKAIKQRKGVHMRKNPEYWRAFKRNKRQRLMRNQHLRRQGWL